MIAGWMVLVVVVGGLLAAAAACLHSIQRSAGHSVRWIWSGAIALLLLLTVTAPWRSGSALEERMIVMAPGVGVAETAAKPLSPWDRFAHGVQSARNAVARPISSAIAAASRAPLSLQRTLGALWLLSSLGVLLLMVRVLRRVHRMRRSWPHHTMHGARVRVSPDSGPAVMGIAPPEIVLPSWILARDAEEQRLVLAHEQQHVLAHDPLLLLLAAFALAVMPWHPAMWYLWSRLRLAVELDCDRRVLRAGAAPRDYGRLLIDLTGHRSALSSGIPAFSYSASHLERRLLAMTSTPARFLAVRRVSGALIAALAVLAACESNLPTSAEIKAMDVAGITKAAAATGMDTANIRFVVDGQQVSEELANKLTEERIATLTFKGKTATNGAVGPVVEIRTTDLQTFPRRAAGDLSLRGDSITLRSAPAGSTKERKFDGLLVVDGAITESSKMNSMDASMIERVEVLKGASASALYSDPRAANGVIKITTKK